MQRYKHVLSIAMLVVLALCQGCSGARTSEPPIAAEQMRSVAETPLAASAFVDSIGVNLHMSYGGTPYDRHFHKWAPILSASGIKHVRDAICPYSMHFCRDVVSARLNHLAKSGIRVDLLTSLSDSAGYVTAYVKTMRLEGTVEAIEGANECDSGLYCPGKWRNIEGNWQKTLSTLRSPAVTVIGPSMVSQNGYRALGDLSQYMDVGNVHIYIGTEPPESQNGLSDHLSWASAMSGTKPVWATETGYATDPRYGKSSVSPVVQERYVARTFFENLRLGVTRTYVYQLFDYGPDDGAYMGLLNEDYTPKPAWTRLEQLIAFFKDDDPSPRTPLHYGIDGDATGLLHHVLFQRSDGTYLLAMWLAAPVYRSEIVDITLPQTAGSATLAQFLDNGATQSTPVAVSNGKVSVPVTSLVSVLTFKT